MTTAAPDGVTRSTRQPEVESAYWLLPLPWSSDAGARALLVALAVGLLLVCPGSDTKRLIINRAGRAGGGESPARPRWRCR
ncbi:MAG: hypothetical protein JWL68_5112 [Actinomycetia bacterium]|nr:hypothetical protein [Actinomycetes bacterium]